MECDIIHNTNFCLHSTYGDHYMMAPSIQHSTCITQNLYSVFQKVHPEVTTVVKQQVSESPIVLLAAMRRTMELEVASNAVTCKI